MPDNLTWDAKAAIKEALLRLDNVTLSERALISVKTANKFDCQKKKGENFSRARFLGIEPARIRAAFCVLPEEDGHFQAAAIPLILREKTPRGNAKPRKVSHPILTRLGITQVIVLSADIGPMLPKEGREVTIEMQEWTQTVSKPNPAPAKSGGLQKDPATGKMTESMFSRQG